MTTRTLCAAAALGALALALGAAPARAAEPYKVDPVHATAIFRIKHLSVGYTWGRFNDVTGDFTWDDANPAGISFDLHVKPESIDTHNDKRDQHLKGPDFFNVREYPDIAFKSTQVRALEANNYEVTGNLTLHGVTRPLTLRLEHTGAGKDPLGMYRRGVETTLVIRRSDFGIKALPDGVGDEVRIMVSIEGVRQ
jgi:polyisoprenoid-binding protein YceI